MWDKTYSSDQFYYGIAPNQFLAEEVEHLQNPILSLGEGEGRNGVFLAEKGFDLLGVDNSQVGLDKAHLLAKKRGVTIETLKIDLNEYEPPAEHFGSVISIFAHMPSENRQKIYKKVIKTLKPEGIFLLEGYEKAQINRNTGGPKNVDMLLSLAELKEAFSGFELIIAREKERHVIEGIGHTGLANVVQFIARKPK